MMDALNSRIATWDDLPQKLKEYPNPHEEKINLALHQQLIREAQSMLKGPPLPIGCGPMSMKPTLETILEFPSSEGVLDIDKHIGNEMWVAVHEQLNENVSSHALPPLTEVDFTHKGKEVLENLPLQDDSQTITSPRSKYTMKTLPSYLGEYQHCSQTLRVSSLPQVLSKERDIGTLEGVLSASVACTLPLLDLMKFWPEIWIDIATCLRDQGFLEKTSHDYVPQETKPVLPIPINMVGKYYEDDQGNATLPVDVNQIASTAILDSGAGLSIATKLIWEKWEKRAICNTRMRLQLVDGSLEQPMGLVENIVVTSRGIENGHTFAIVDFGKNTNYEGQGSDSHLVERTCGCVGLLAIISIPNRYYAIVVNVHYALPKAIQFCDLDGYDIIPIRMVQPFSSKEIVDDFFYEDSQIAMRLYEVSIEALTSESANGADTEKGFDFDSDDDSTVLEEELEKVRLLLKHREILPDIPHDHLKCKFCNIHRKFYKLAERKRV
ncbi:hypothetical protein L7F22_038405 [Adiantum nelumboides]|nr:hypothetical protein [Adiantum nelumboides]